MRTPADVLSALIADDPTRPALTFYEDSPGPQLGERIELSRKVLGTWVAKAANALQESYDCEPGTVVHLDIPAPHWRLTYWAWASWSIGATVTLDASEGADILITTVPDQPHARDADEVIAVTLAALAREFGGPLRSGVMDEAREISSFADSFEPWDAPEPGDAALVVDGRRISYADLVNRAEQHSGPPAGAARTLITTAQPGSFLTEVLGVWAQLGSAVMVRGTTSAVSLSDARMRSEGVERALG